MQRMQGRKENLRLLRRLGATRRESQAGSPQTLRVIGRATELAKRLDCGELAPAFTAGLPTAVNTASADEPLLSPLK